METRKLRIGICAKQTDDLSPEAEPTVMNVFCEASVTDDGEEITVEYDEYLVEGGGSTHTKLIFKKNEPGSVSMVRTGLVKMACSFAKGERFNCVYSMSDGIALDFCMVTKELENTVSLGGGRLIVKYNIEVRGLVISKNEYRLTVLKK